MTENTANLKNTFQKFIWNDRLSYMIREDVLNEHIRIMNEVFRELEQASDCLQKYLDLIHKYLIQSVIP